MNFKEIVGKLEELGIDKHDFANLSPKFNSDLGESKIVERYCGEGEGESWGRIRYFSDHHVYIRLDGYYTSYDGVNLDDSEYEEVFPHKKFTTVYSTSITDPEA